MYVDNKVLNSKIMIVVKIRQWKN